MKDVAFIPHCDEPDCYYGTVEFVCPQCGLRQTSYNLELYHRIETTVACVGCGCFGPLEDSSNI